MTKPDAGNAASAQRTRAQNDTSSIHATDGTHVAQICVRAMAMLLMAALSLASFSASAVSSAERQALIDLYNSTNGATWTTKTNWNGGVGTECTWFGVQCSLITSGNVITVSLPNNNLTGTLPTTVPGLAALDKINVLQLNNNQISGTIPSLSALVEANTIDLSFNQLTGGVPPLTPLAAKLGAVSFANNQLTGSIPSLTGMAVLRGFDVSNNQLTGPIPSITGLTELVGFSVKHNLLTGSLPNLAGLTNLEIFYAYQNQLTGTIPALTGLTALQQFHVYTNQLTGSVPSVAGLTNLTQLSAYDNQLNGTIGSLTGATNLALYLLYDNQLTGSIPSLAGLTNLQIIQLEDNQLTGGLPSLTGLTNLLFFQADNNQLTGSIPSLTGLTGLVRYTVAKNQLTGTIPSLSGLTGLGYFLVYKNQLTGTMPSLAGLNNLIDIEVAQNKLTGTLPAVDTLPNLEQLIVSGNQFSGPIPAPPPSLIADGSDLRYNALVPNGNPSHTAIWNAAQTPGNDWQATQTVAPIGVSATASGTAVTVSWTPIAYTGDTGAYEVYKSTTPGGPYTLAVSTANKSASSASVPGLSALTTYYFVVATRTDAHVIAPDPSNTNNANIVRSANSAEVSVATTNPVTPTTTTLVSSRNPSSQGTAVTFTATVTGGSAPTGNVIFRDADSIFFTTPLQLVGANYQATYTINNLATGTHPFTAQYVGNATNATSTSAVLNQIVSAPATTFSGVTATGTGPASASFTGGGPDCSFEENLTAFVLPPNSAPVPGATQPHGQFNFTLVHCPTYYPVTMSVTWPSLTGMTYYKYGPTNISGGNSVWYQPDGLVIVGNTATYELRDGAFGDDDNLYNFQIVDPSGPVVIPPQPPGTPVASEISNVVGGHTCARLAPSGFKCWGLNSNRELGNGTNTPTSFPVDVQNVPANTAVIQAVRNGTCLISNTGGLKCWGYNGDGELGNGTQGGTPSPTPVDVTGLGSGVAQVTGTASGRCALTSAGGVKCWGRDLDQSTVVFHLTPIDVPGLTSGVIQIVGGYGHMCALTVSGGVKCWGPNSRNQLGDGTTTPHYTPADVTGLTSGVAQIASGADHACALLTTGGIKCWGYNPYGQVGDNGSVATNRPTPVDVFGLTNGIDVHGGFGHTCAILADGAMKCWGQSQFFGQVGDGSFVNRPAPVQVVGLTSGYVATSGGGNISCGKSATGGVKCWGNGDSSNGTGTGTTGNSPTPLDVVGLTGGNHVISGFTPPAPPLMPLTKGVGQSLTLSANSSAGLPVTFSTYTPDRCTVTGDQVQFIAVGLCFVRATAAGNSSFTAAPDVTRLILVAAAAPQLTLTPLTLPSGPYATPYSQNLTATGGLGPYSFAVTSGSLPPGLTLEVSGAIAGTPTASGNFSFTATATDSTGSTGARAYTIVIGGGPINNANLSGLVVSSGTLSPPFAPGTFAYTNDVLNCTTAITLTPTLQDPLASVKVNGTTVANGTRSAPINLVVGINAISAVVTAQDGVTTQNYAVAVTRPAPVPLAPVLQGAVSRKVHGAAGPFDLALSLLANNPTTDPRRGPAQTLVFTFDKAITGVAATIAEGSATAGTPTISGNDVVVDLANVPDQAYVTVELGNVASSDGGTGGCAIARVGFLMGDVNQNRVVTVSDLGLVNGQLAQVVSQTNFLKDVNASGTLTLSDKGMTNGNLTRALPAP